MTLSHRLSRSVLISIVCLMAFTMSGIPTVQAQSPYPNANMLDVNPYSGYPNGWQGVVVEGLGSLSCSYNSTDIETKTVSFINMPNNTMTEISPQSYCGSISQYETLIANIANYVNSHASNPGYRWGGIMLDEEAGSASDCSASGFGFSASQLESLHNWAYNFFINTPGTEWFYTEDFAPAGCWSQTVYDNVVGFSQPAPQISTNKMVGLANGWDQCQCQYTLVTWSSVYPYPYNSESASVNAIKDVPFRLQGWNWANQFQGA